MKPKAALVLIAIIIAVIVFSLSVFTVDETEQVIITRLGEYVRTVTDPGLHFKVPVLQNTIKFEDRVLEYDSSADQILTSDKKKLIIDNYARWRISNPLEFYQTVHSESGAQARLDDIIFSEIREELARHTLSEVISVNRDKLMELVTEQCRDKAKEFGIEIIDVRIKRADLPKEVAPAVYARMRAERAMIAKRYRSEGKEEATKIRAQTDKEKTIMLAESYQFAEKLKGEGDAEAIKIYAEAFEKDPEFYSFIKTLETYEKSLDKDTTIVLPADSEFFKYLDTK